MTAPRRILLTVIVLVGLVLGGACSGAGTDDAAGVGPGDERPTSGETDGDDGAGGGQRGEETSAGDAAAPGGVTAVDVVPVDLDTTVAAERRLAYRGAITATVTDVGGAVSAARTAVAAEGGFLFGQQAGDRGATVTFKVPALAFDAAFDAVAAIGTVTDRRVEADDVTAQFVDLESRRDTLSASIARLRGFLAEAATVDELARLESELAHRESEHDVIAGQLRALEARTVLATLTVVFTLHPDQVLPVDQADDGGPPGFLAGLGAGWSAVRVIAVATATGLGYILPFTPLAVPVAVVGYRLWRRRRPVPVAP